MNVAGDTGTKEEPGGIIGFLMNAITSMRCW